MFLNNDIMKTRLDTYNKQSSDKEVLGVQGLVDMSHRLKTMGGHRQQERMILDKKRSLERAIWNSYQGADIKKSDSDEIIRCLINPNKLKQDYDDKIVSAGFEFGLKCGDIFEWVGTNTHWLIYLQDLTELAYFRGDIRKCSYEIAWVDENGLAHSTYAAVRGPVETKINYIQKHGISVDSPNHSLNILLPLNENTLKQFKRYNKFYLQDKDICWRVEATDTISTPGILEINATEYYANECEDDIKNGLVGALIVSQDNPNTEEVEEIILGETFIKPKKQYVYNYNGQEEGVWKIDSKIPVDYIINDKEIKIKWRVSYSGQFDICYGDSKKTIVVESLF